MHFLLSLCLVLSVSSSAWGVIAEVGAGSQRASKATTTSVDSTTLAFPGNVTAGSLLVVAGYAGSTPASIAVSDTLTTSYTVVTYAVGVRRAFIAYGVAGASAANTVTINPSGATSPIFLAIDEFSGQDAGPLDVALVTNTSTSTTPDVTVAPVASGDLIVGYLSAFTTTNFTITQDGAFTLIGEFEAAANGGLGVNGSAVFKILTDASSTTPAWTISTSLQWMTVGIAFRPVQASGGHGTRRRQFIMQ